MSIKKRGWCVHQPITACPPLRPRYASYSHSPFYQFDRMWNMYSILPHLRQYRTCRPQDSVTCQSCPLKPHSFWRILCHNSSMPVTSSDMPGLPSIRCLSICPSHSTLRQWRSLLPSAVGSEPHRCLSLQRRIFRRVLFLRSKSCSR